jgi:hypothetical protein
MQGLGVIARVRLRFFMLLAIVWGAPAHGLVDMNSASYSHSWQDIDADATGIPFNRSYRSRTLYAGLFGFGWCSPLETALRPLSDDAFALVHCGDGMVQIFTAGDRSDFRRIARVAETARRLGLRKEGEDGLASLIGNSDEDYGEWMARTGLGSRSLPLGRFIADDGSVAESTPAGVHVRPVAGRDQWFDPNGQLVRMTSHAGQTISIVRSATRWRISSDVSTIDLILTGNGPPRVARIQMGDDVLSEYRYVNDDLVWNRNQWGSIYNYEYNAYHNLTHVAFSDGTSLSIEYDDEKDWVMAFRDRGNCREQYAYFMQPTIDEPQLEQRRLALLRKVPDVTMSGGGELNYYSMISRRCPGGYVNWKLFYFNHVPDNADHVKLSRIVTLSSDGADKLFLYRLGGDDARYVYDIRDGGPTLRSSPGRYATSVGTIGTTRSERQINCSAFRGIEVWTVLAGLPRHVAVDLAYRSDYETVTECPIDSMTISMDGKPTRMKFHWRGNSIAEVSTERHRYAMDAKSTHPAFTWTPDCLALSRSERGDKLMHAIAAAHMNNRCDEEELAIALTGALRDGGWGLPEDAAHRPREPFAFLDETEIPKVVRQPAPSRPSPSS